MSEKVKSFFRKAPGIEKDVDEYLTENIPSMLKKYKIARKNDIQDTIKDMDTKEEKVEELINWKDKTKPKVNDLNERISRLEKKHGVK